MDTSEIQEVTIETKEYPPLLKTINDPPTRLYVRGDISILSAPYILASVGSRKATPYGKQAVGLLLPQLIQQHVVVASGLAYGIDALSHKCAVEAKKPTIAVLGGGIDDATIYPRVHKKLAQEILGCGGAIISEWPEKTPARPAHFLQRNRIIAGLAQATLVVQAATRSGSLVTSRLALDYNREVLAVPGPITDLVSQGTNLLIQEGARPALTSEDIADALGITIDIESETHTEDLSESQKLIYTELSSTPQHIDDITVLVKLPAEQVASLLLELELLDRVKNTGGMKYVKK